MDETVTKYKKPLNIRTMASKVGNRSDCIYKTDVIRDVLNMYFEECENVLLEGEKVGLPGIGSLTPHVHTPMSYNVPSMNDEGGNNPYTTIKFTRYTEMKQKMNRRYLKNMEAGFAGLGENCKCNQMQKNLLIDQGLLKIKEKEEEEN